MVADHWWWVAIIWGLVFGWLFLFLIEKGVGLKARTMAYVAKVQSKVLLNVVDGFSTLFLMALTGGLFFGGPLKILPCGKRYFLSYFGFYLMTCFIGALIRLRRFISWACSNGIIKPPSAENDT